MRSAELSYRFLCITSPKWRYTTSARIKNSGSERAQYQGGLTRLVATTVYVRDNKPTERAAYFPFLIADVWTNDRDIPSQFEMAMPRSGIHCRSLKWIKSMQTRTTIDPATGYPERRHYREGKKTNRVPQSLFLKSELRLSSTFTYRLYVTTRHKRRPLE